MEQSSHWPSGPERETISYPSRSDGVYNFDISPSTLEPFGFFFGERVKVLGDKQAWVIGVHNSQLYFHIDGNEGASFWKDFTKPQFEKYGFKRLSPRFIYPNAEKRHNAPAFRPLLLEAPFSDVTFVVGEERINAHRAILVSRSNYFRAMFQGGLQESCFEPSSSIPSLTSLYAESEKERNSEEEERWEGEGATEGEGTGTGTEVEDLMNGNGDSNGEIMDEVGELEKHEPRSKNNKPTYDEERGKGKEKEEEQEREKETEKQKGVKRGWEKEKQAEMSEEQKKRKKSKGLQKEPHPVVHIQELDGADFRAVLEFLYTGRLVMQENNVVGLIKAADMFQLDDLFEHILASFDDYVNIRNVCSFYVASDRFSQDKLKIACKEFILDHYSTLITMPEFSSTMISEDNAQLLLEVMQCLGVSRGNKRKREDPFAARKAAL